MLFFSVSFYVGRRPPSQGLLLRLSSTWSEFESGVRLYEVYPRFKIAGAPFSDGPQWTAAHHFFLFLLFFRRALLILVGALVYRCSVGFLSFRCFAAVFHLRHVRQRDFSGRSGDGGRRVSNEDTSDYPADNVKGKSPQAVP